METMSRFENFDAPVEPPEAKSASNRDRFPEMSKVVDQFRSVFGQVKVMLVEEGGDHVQSQSYMADEDYRGCINAGEWLEMSKRHPPTEDPRNNQERPFEQK